MRKILIVISLLILVLATAVGGAYMYVQYQLSLLPVENLKYRIAAVGYKHIRLAEVSFTYIEPTRDVDALSSGFRSGEAAVEAPVRLNDVFVSWQWHGFSPNLQIVEVGELDATLSHWPAAIEASDTDGDIADWQLPTDWRVPDDLPYQVEIKTFVVDLPCSDRCYYSGSVNFTSDNKEQLLSRDDTQHTQLSLAISPHQHFDEMEQLNLYLDYRVTGDLPELDLIVQSPMGLNLESNQRIDPNNRLSGDIALQLEPSAQWIFAQLWRWWPQLQSQSEPALGFLSDTLTVNAAYQGELPETSVARWANEIDAELAAELTLQDQLSIDIESQLYRDDQITFDGAFEVTLLPGLRANLNPLLERPDNADESAFQPTAVIAQIDAPVILAGDWDLQFPPGTTFDSWPQQADGRLAIDMQSDNQFSFEHFALMALASQAEIRLAAGMVSDLDVIINGGVELLTFNQQLNDFSLDPDRVHWSVHIDTGDFIDWNDLPVHLQAQSTGTSDLTLDLQLRADIEDYVRPTEGSQAAQMSLHSQRGQIMMTQPELRIADLRAQGMALDLPFSVNFSTAQGLNLTAAGGASLSTAFSIPLNDDAVRTEQLEVDLSDWQWHTPIEAIEDSQISARLDIHAANVAMPALLPLNWHWSGHLTAQPLHAQPTGEAEGRLTNNVGLILRQQLKSNAEQLTLDWQLADIFWLAGNPVAATLDDLWPELLTLERGRTRASGRLEIPFADRPLSLSAELELMDVAGIYDTASFSGVRAVLRGHSDGNEFTFELDDGYLQRLQYGMTHGPGELQLRYQGAVSSPLDGQLDIGNNRLNVLNGEVSLVEASYDLSQSEHIFHVDISQLDIARLLAEYPAADIQGHGLLSGSIPVRYSPAGIFVDNGRISALPPGGQIQYRSDRARQMAQSNVAMGIVMDALDDFHYSALQGDVTYLEDGTLLIGLLVAGHNPNLENGRPVRLEVTLQEDLPALLTSLQLTNQLNELIQERIQQRLIQSLRN